jgi:ADP-ribose pyrophosphatase YjhB (NUDIX family)
MAKPKRLPYKEFISIYKKVPRVGVDLVIRTSQGVLLTKRDIKPAKGKWHLPGGTVLRGEKLKDAIDRIAFEETGLKLKIKKIIGVAEYLSQNDATGHTVCTVFLLTPTSGELRGSFQAKTLKYFNKLPKDTLKEHREFLNANRLP